MRRPCDIACGQGGGSRRNLSDLSHERLRSIICQAIDMELMLITLLAILWRNNVWGLIAGLRGRLSCWCTLWTTDPYFLEGLTDDTLVELTVPNMCAPDRLACG
jgi:hypothetical protein